jgi:branched-chain amino acid aminotransferase
MIKDAQPLRTLVWPTPNAKFASQPVEQRFTTGAAYVDGQFCPIEDARIPLLDWGFLRSDACQDTISVWDGSFFRLQDHLERFQRSIGRLWMTSPESPDRIRSIVHELVVLPSFRNAYVQISRPAADRKP